MPTRTNLTRRPFSYEIEIKTSRTVQENADLLRRFLEDQKGSSGLVLLDPRIEGSVYGPTFTLQRRGAAWWGAAPDMDGAFVPTARGSDVRLTVSWSRSSTFILAAQGMAVFAVLLMANGVSLLHVLGALVTGTLLAGSLGVASTLFRGEYAARLAREIFCRNETTTPD
jgi:hypothetical protein